MTQPVSAQTAYAQIVLKELPTLDTLKGLKWKIDSFNCATQLYFWAPTNLAFDYLENTWQQIDKQTQEDLASAGFWKILGKMKKVDLVLAYFMEGCEGEDPRLAQISLKQKQYSECLKEASSIDEIEKIAPKIEEHEARISNYKSTNQDSDKLILEAKKILKENKMLLLFATQNVYALDIESMQYANEIFDDFKEFIKKDLEQLEGLDTSEFPELKKKIEKKIALNLENLEKKISSLKEDREPAESAPEPVEQVSSEATAASEIVLETELVQQEQEASLEQLLQALRSNSELAMVIEIKNGLTQTVVSPLTTQTTSLTHLIDHHLYSLHLKEQQLNDLPLEYGKKAFEALEAASMEDRIRAVQRAEVDAELGLLQEGIKNNDASLISQSLERLEKVQLDPKDLPEEIKNVAHALYGTLYQVYLQAFNESTEEVDEKIDPNDSSFVWDFGRVAFTDMKYAPFMAVALKKTLESFEKTWVGN